MAKKRRSIQLSIRITQENWDYLRETVTGELPVDVLHLSNADLVDYFISITRTKLATPVKLVRRKANQNL